MRYPTMWYVQPAKPQISACAYAQADQSLCKLLENSMTVKQADQTSFGISKLKRRLHRLAQDTTLLEIITCHDSYMFRERPEY